MADEDDHVFDGLQLVTPEASTILYEGMLKKKSPQALIFLRPWQERYCRLTPNGLFYYRDKNLPHQGAIPLSVVASIELDPARYRFHLILDPQYDRIFSFTAKKDTFSRWSAELRRAHEECQRIKRTAPVQEQPEGDVAGAVPGAPRKIWKNKDKSDDKKGGAVKQSSAAGSTGTNLQPYVFHQFLPSDWIGNSGRPIYQLSNTPQRVGLFDSFPMLCSEVFGTYKIQSEEQISDIGSVYLLGDSHYSMTYRSYLMHCVFKNNPNLQYALNTMEIYRQLSQFPLFPSQLTFGETSDAVYAIYHPPVRQTMDSFFSWLAQVQRFPESIVQWISIHLLLAFEYVHPLGLQLITLSPETLFFDGDGMIRIIDLLLSPALSTSVPEYTPPEVVRDGYESSTHAADYWRLGVLFYELAVGVPPIRSDETTIQASLSTLDMNSDIPLETQELHLYEQAIYSQLKTYKHTDLVFPPFISPSLRQFITQLMHEDPSQRLTALDQIKKHSFYQNIPSTLWEIEHLLSQPCPAWIEENVLDKLHENPQTPVNLTYKSEGVSLQRIVVGTKQIRGLPRSVNNQRIYCSVTIDGDIQKTSPASRASDQDEGAAPFCDDTLVIDESLTFDMAHGYHFPQSSDIIIEVISKDRENRGMTGVIGAVTFPIRELRTMQQVNSWLVIYDYNGIPLGELRLELTWETVPIDLNSTLLSSLTDTTRSLPEWFGKPVAPPPNKLYSLIIDSSILPLENELDLQDNMAGGLTSNLLQANASQFTSGTPPRSNPKSPILLAVAQQHGTPSATPLMNASSPSMFGTARSSPSLGPLNPITTGSGARGSHDGSGSPSSSYLHPSPSTPQMSTRQSPSGTFPAMNPNASSSGNTARGLGSTSSGGSTTGNTSFHRASLSVAGRSPADSIKSLQPSQNQQQQQPPPPPPPGHRGSILMVPPPSSQQQPPPPPPGQRFSVFTPGKPVGAPGADSNHNLPPTNLTSTQSDIMGKPPQQQPPPPPPGPRPSVMAPPPIPHHRLSLLQVPSNITNTSVSPNAAHHIASQPHDMPPTPPAPPPPSQSTIASAQPSQQHPQQSKPTNEVTPSPGSSYPPKSSPPPPPDPNDVPENWRFKVDPQSGDTYYYNKITKLVTWDPPECAIALLQKKMQEKQQSGK